MKKTSTYIILQNCVGHIYTLLMRNFSAVDDNTNISYTYHRGLDWVVCVVGDSLSSGSEAWILECGVVLGMYQHRSTVGSTQMSKMKEGAFPL